MADRYTTTVECKIYESKETVHYKGTEGIWGTNIDSKLEYFEANRIDDSSFFFRCLKCKNVGVEG